MYDQEYILSELLMIITFGGCLLGMCIWGFSELWVPLFDIEVFVMGMRALAVVAAVQRELGSEALLSIFHCIFCVIMTEYYEGQGQLLLGRLAYIIERFYFVPLNVAVGARGSLTKVSPGIIT